MEDYIEYALSLLDTYVIDYADIRIRETRRQNLFVIDNNVKHFNDMTQFGFGIRILRNGVWGFASASEISKSSIEKIAQQAYEIAKASEFVGVDRKIELTKEDVHVDKFKTSIEIDPFKVPASDKIGLMLEISERVRKIKDIQKFMGNMYFKKKHQYFASTEGSKIETDIFTVSAGYRAVAVGNNDSQTRAYQQRPRNIGYEWIKEQPLLEDAERVAEEAAAKLYAEPSPTGEFDLVLTPSHLALTMHESVGHPTELDRVLGWEANFAGTSFATPEKLGNFQYGSDIVNFKADNNLKYGLATQGYDDDGVKSQDWYIIKDGILQNYSTTRETAPFLNQEKSFGANRADSYSSMPINRIPNLFLLSGKEKLSPDELINDTKNGIFIDGMGSFSIDQKRLNFQFGGDLFWEIKNGKKTRMLKNVTYQSLSPEFWNSCDAVCDEDHWEDWGVLNCGKGEPSQTMQMTHGASTARFRNIKVGGAK